MIESGADVRHQAALWLLELQDDGDNPALRARWQRWHDASPENRLAWHRVEAFADSLGEMPSALVHAALLPAPRSRRRALKTLGLMLAAGATTWTVVDSRQVPILLASQRTAPGERRQLTLADGSRIDVNSDSALDIRFDGSQRRIVLQAGEVHVVTAPDPAGRPFFVDTPQGRTRPVGTRFTVRTGPGDTSRVAVHAGAVAIQPRRGKSGEALMLAAGEQASFSERMTTAPVPVSETDAAWTRGILVAREMPLPDFIAELARLGGRRLSCDAALAALKVSGTYPLAEPERVLAFLVDTLPVRVEVQQRWWGGREFRLRPA